MYRKIGLSLVCCFALFAGYPRYADADVKIPISVQAGVSLYAPSLNFGVEGGVRWSQWGVLAKVEWNPWVAIQGSEILERGSLNVALGVEYLYFGGRCRSAFLLGTSILLFDTALDDAGSTGAYLEIDPVSLRWVVKDWLAVRWDPLSFAMVVPVMSGIPLVMVQYRTSLVAEMSF
jgi:hypothetical protein